MRSNEPGQMRFVQALAPRNARAWQQVGQDNLLWRLADVSEAHHGVPDKQYCKKNKYVIFGMVDVYITTDTKIDQILLIEKTV